MSILTVPCASPRLEEGDADRTREADASEARRQATLDSLKILHTLPEDAYERIVRRVSEYFDTPGCLISFATRNQQWFKARVGVTIETAPRESSFCQAALETDGVYVVHDATKNPRFAEHPFVVGEPGIRFYAGVALVFGEAQRIGTLCVIDTRPRVFGLAEAAALEDFAALVVDELRLRAQTLRLEAELQRQREAEQAALALQKARADFLAMVTHEVRAPLNAIAGAVSLMCQPGGALPDEFAAEALRDSTGHLVRLLNEVLDLAKLEATGFTFNYEPFDLRRELRCAVASVKAQTLAKTVNLELDIDAGMPAAVMGDRTRIAQVLMNLLSNAIKFTAQGTVTVSASTRRRDDARIDLVISVTDTGIGIEAAAACKLFGDFEQADAAVRTRYGGTGLGLAICRKLVAGMGGAIEVTSAPGAGSTFTCTIPSMVANDVVPTPSGPACTFSRSDQLVLIADDDDVSRKVGEALLKRLGYRVEAVSNGRDALAALRTKPFDLAVLDINMPDLDGVSLARELQAQTEFGSPVPLVALTGDARPLDDPRAAVFDDYLLKPVSPEALDRAIVNVLSRRDCAAAPACLESKA
ncbi:hybrid sensor histidine kinase/response regulator [Paraburkholderia kururiensis]|uniref:hybrid sensor histidine kinase/response regulator n=1 Tax=Paraburkholderia kururiensis TaxID=984307 RepID=UPI0009DD3A1A|nr:ATP-binding protein [Paraburkholderia kururiensis]